MVHRIKKGLYLPISGKPEQVIDRRILASRVALLADDYIGLRPTMHVSQGDSVRRGQLLFEDKKTQGVRYTSPAQGRVVAINRGARRAFQSLIIELSTAERSGRGDQEKFGAFTGRHPSGLNEDGVKELLLESGLWTALRTRPFSRIANPATRPHSIFVTAVDTEPLAPDVDVAILNREDDLARGLAALTHLSDGPVFFCTSDNYPLPVPTIDGVRHEKFSGQHPAGTVGLHIHTLDPVDRNRTVWHLGYQDTLAIGQLFGTGMLDVERIISLAGPAVQRPRLLRTRLGSATAEITKDELASEDTRVISGSVLSGQIAMGPIKGFLGRYHRQISVLAEYRNREFLGWAELGFSKYSTTGAFLSRLLPNRHFALTTTTNGSQRAIVPIGLYEQVMPFDLQPTFLLKALIMNDLERAEQLGCLELDAEDLALCTFLCPGKNTYGPYLRKVLTAVEKEG